MAQPYIQPGLRKSAEPVNFTLESMRPYPDELKTTLRHLAAARYFLPVVLSTPAEWEEQYIEYLHHTEFELALDSLEGIGESHSGYAEEHLFWQELLFAAENMELLEHAARYKEYLSKLDVL